MIPLHDPRDIELRNLQKEYIRLYNEYNAPKPVWKRLAYPVTIFVYFLAVLYFGNPVQMFVAYALGAIASMLAARNF